jgi:hypothetical protein
MYLIWRVSGELHAPAALLLKKEPPFEKGLCGPQNSPERCGEEVNLLLLPGVEPQYLGCPDRSPSTTLTKSLGFQQGHKHPTVPILATNLILSSHVIPGVTC